MHSKIRQHDESYSFGDSPHSRNVIGGAGFIKTCSFGDFTDLQIYTKERTVLKLIVLEIGDVVYAL